MRAVPNRTKATPVKGDLNESCVEPACVRELKQNLEKPECVISVAQEQSPQQKKEKIEMYYYYHKERGGRELCHEVAEISGKSADYAINKDAEEALEEIERETGETITYKDGDVWSVAEEPGAELLPIDGEPDFYALLHAWSDTGAYSILPQYIDGDKVTEKELTAEGKYALAAILFPPPDEAEEPELQ